MSPVLFSVTVSGLSKAVSMEDIKASFLKFGEIHSLTLSASLDSKGASTGTAIISFTSSKSATESAAFFHGRTVDGNTVLSVVYNGMVVSSPLPQKTVVEEFYVSPVGRGVFVSKMKADIVESGMRKMLQETRMNGPTRLHPNHTLKRAEPYTQSKTMNPQLAKRLGYKAAVDPAVKELGEVSRISRESSYEMYESDNKQRSMQSSGASFERGESNDRKRVTIQSRLGLKKLDIGERLGSQVDINSRLGAKK